MFSSNIIYERHLTWKSPNTRSQRYSQYAIYLPCVVQSYRTVISEYSRLKIFTYKSIKNL